MTLKHDMAKALLGVSNPAGGATDVSVLASQMSGGYFPAGSSTGLLPRRDSVFLGNFGPSYPATPSPIDTDRNGLVLPRRWQYPVGYNLPTAPGATKLIDFRVLEQLADIYDILRRCIEVRKQEMAQLRWEIVPRDQDLLKPRAKKPAEMDEAIKALSGFFENPDPIQGLGLGDWLKLALEELFVKDALSIFPHPTWMPGKGVAGSNLFALEILDGKTIKPLLDIRGARPLPPDAAYQQYIWGIPRSEMAAQYTAEGAPLGDPDAKTFLAADGGSDSSDAPALYYKPYNRRTYSPYGFSNVEQIILNVNLALKRQQFHTAFFTDGTVPAGIIFLDKDLNPTATQVREFEEGWNLLLSGDQAWKHKMRVLAGGDKFQQLKPSYFGDQEVNFDRWLALITCVGMDVTTMEVGLGPSSTTGLGGKGYGDAEENVTERKSLRPIMEFFSKFFNHVIASWFAHPELEFKFLYDQAEDALKKAQEDEILIRTAVKVPNEARVERGLDPYDGVDDQGNKLGDSPLIIASRTIAMLGDVNAISKQAAGQNPDGTAKPGALEIAQARGMGPDRTNAAANPQRDPAAGEDAKGIAAQIMKMVQQELGSPTIDDFEIEHDLVKASITLPIPRQATVHVHPTPVTVPPPIINLPKVAAPIVNIPAPVVNVPAPIVNVAAPAPAQMDFAPLIESIGKLAESKDERGDLEILRDKYDKSIVTGVRRKRKE